MREFFLWQMYLHRVLFLSPVHFNQTILTLDSTAGKQRISCCNIPSHWPTKSYILAIKIVSFVRNSWWLEVETLAGVSSKLMCETHCLCEAECLNPGVPSVIELRLLCHFTKPLPSPVTCAGSKVSCFGTEMISLLG